MGHYYIVAIAMSVTVTPLAVAQSAVPFRTGAAIVQTLHNGSADRESIVSLFDVSPQGVEYRWTLRDVFNDRDTVRNSFKTFVRADDEAHAVRWREVFYKDDPFENPGYTRFTVSTGVLDQLRSAGSAEFSILSVEEPSGGLILGGKGVAIRWRGKLSRIGRESFPLLVNGQRISVPAIHARGDFTGRNHSWSPDFWILEDASHPLILKLTDQQRVFQTVRINFIDTAMLDAMLKGKCRVEIPGVYFDFNSASLDPASDKAIAALAGVFAKHPDWSITIEGHTDNVGTDAANQKLSERRAESVRARLVNQYHIAASHILSAGFGARVPRETNATIEGRAHNRRVELVRPCGGNH